VQFHEISNRHKLPFKFSRKYDNYAKMSLFSLHFTKILVSHFRDNFRANTKNCENSENINYDGASG
jgi:hypothetical protein